MTLEPTNIILKMLIVYSRKLQHNVVIQCSKSKHVVWVGVCPGGVGVSGAERDVEYDSLEGAGEVGASPELEGVAQAEVEDLGV